MIFKEGEGGYKKIGLAPGGSQFRRCAKFIILIPSFDSLNIVFQKCSPLMVAIGAVMIRLVYLIKFLLVQQLTVARTVCSRG